MMLGSVTARWRLRQDTAALQASTGLMLRANSLPSERPSKPYLELLSQPKDASSKLHPAHVRIFLPPEAEDQTILPKRGSSSIYPARILTQESRQPKMSGAGRARVMGAEVTASAASAGFCASSLHPEHLAGSLPY